MLEHASLVAKDFRVGGFCCGLGADLELRIAADTQNSVKVLWMDPEEIC